ncbi:uncharacterized protein [Aegilops tauschii subsp. strangulata]|uniref:Late embryogenesis abundant protein LEA-2 subgroup domain-containing protein n=1 Tax=Aegilops tauschii TaxID=37682 RepID=M8AMX5_AEGTA|nr:uncharacterized protein LOC109745898 [Aegilops tauschii subsp. strangulata]XP_044400699.1 uncharacterized protein LOC123124058 [Triticum aestivum]
MAGDDGEHTRFPCLGWVRTSVAIVVTVLVLVLVVMAITDVGRPEKISLSSYGYVQTQQRWWNDSMTTTTGRTTTTKSRRLPAEGPEPELMPATLLTILVIVFAYNPSGRGSILCNITTISIIDMPYDDFTGMVEVHRVYSPKMPLKFSVPPQTWHRDRRSVNITEKNDNGVLSYLFAEHRQQEKFRVMVQVNTTYKAQHSAASVNVSHYCWPVFFVYLSPYVDGDQIPCKTSQEMGYSFSWQPLPDGADG